MCQHWSRRWHTRNPRGSSTLQCTRPSRHLWSIRQCRTCPQGTTGKPRGPSWRTSQRSTVFGPALVRRSCKNHSKSRQRKSSPRCTCTGNVRNAVSPARKRAQCHIKTTFTHAPTNTLLLTPSHTHTRTHVHKHTTQTRTHTDTHTQTHRHTHTRARARTRIHTYN